MLKHCITTTRTILKRNRPTKQKHWISDETLQNLQIIEKRRLLHQKGIYTEEERKKIQTLNKEIKRGCKTDNNSIIHKYAKKLNVTTKRYF